MDGWREGGRDGGRCTDVCVRVCMCVYASKKGEGKEGEKGGGTGEREGREEGRKKINKGGGKAYLTSQGLLNLAGGGAEHLLKKSRHRDLQGGGGGEAGAQGHAGRDGGFEDQIFALGYV